MVLLVLLAAIVSFFAGAIAMRQAIREEFLKPGRGSIEIGLFPEKSEIVVVAESHEVKGVGAWKTTSRIALDARWIVPLQAAAEKLRGKG